MKRYVKPVVAAAAVMFAQWSFLSATSYAQGTFVEGGTTTLADSLGTATGSEALNVQWAVYDQSGVYTYFYQLNNPAGDVVLNSEGQPISPTTPAVVNTFQLYFDTSVPGSFLSGNQTFNYGNANGLLWVFPTAVSPGSSSELMAFQSDLAPGTGSASALSTFGGSPPSPWAQSLSSTPIAVPQAAPEPETISFLVLTALGLPFALRPRRSIKP